MASLFDVKPVGIVNIGQSRPEITTRYPTAKARAEAAAEIIMATLLKEGFGEVLGMIELSPIESLEMGEATLISIRSYRTEWDDE